MIDRRINSREFVVAGWDPYILSLVANGKTWDRQLDSTGRNRKLGPTRWRTMLIQRLSPKTRR
jgi:hypothetical protein